MKRTYTDPIMLRLSVEMRARVAEIAREEGNSETAVLRRLIATGLDVVRPLIARPRLPSDQHAD